jgi:hypothetical protein
MEEGVYIAQRVIARLEMQHRRLFLRFDERHEESDESKKPKNAHE